MGKDKGLKRQRIEDRGKKTEDNRTKLVFYRNYSNIGRTRDKEQGQWTM